MLSDKMYFECHVTTEPVEGVALETFRSLCEQHRFRPANLLMQKGAGLAPSDLDMFCTTRGDQLEDVQSRMRQLVDALRGAGLTVWRAKIEVAILDEVYVPKSERRRL